MLWVRKPDVERQSEYRMLAEQAERQAETAPAGGIKTAWQQIATGFRTLARMHEAAVRRFRDKAEGEGKDRE